MMFIICILLGMALALTLTLWRLFFLKRDIRQLEHTLETIPLTSTHTQLTTNTFDTDITALAENINILLERHQQDLLEKAHAEAALRRTLTNISHDLRTPLTSALGYLQMLADAKAESSETGVKTESSEAGLPTLSQETRAQYLTTVRERLETLSTQMNTLFEFAHLIEGYTPFNIQRINICNVLRNTLSTSYSKLESRGFIVNINIPDTPDVSV